MDIERALKSEADRRPLFHSEADFRFNLAWSIKELWPESTVTLERKPRGTAERRYIDIWVRHGDADYAVELKYPTRALTVALEDEEFDLREHSAHDIIRYDFLKDIQRLEDAIVAGGRVIGQALMVTNDSNYWNPPVRFGTADEQFRIHEGQTLAGHLSWGPTAGTGTRKGREEPFELSGTYTVA